MALLDLEFIISLWPFVRPFIRSFTLIHIQSGNGACECVKNDQRPHDYDILSILYF